MVPLPVLFHHQVLRRLSLKLPTWAARFGIHGSSDLPTLREWIMTYRLFFSIFGIWSCLESCKSLPCCKTISEGPHCLITSSALLATVAQLSRVAETTWDMEITRSPVLLLPEHLKHSGNSDFCCFSQTDPWGTISSKLGPRFARKAQKDDGCCYQLLAFQQAFIFISKYICTARKCLLTRMR